MSPELGAGWGGRQLVLSQPRDFLSALPITGTKHGLFTLTMFSESRQFVIQFTS